LKTDAEIVAAIQSLDGFNLPMIAMTWGGNGAIVKSDREFYRVKPIKVQAVNEGGCGDAFLAGIIAGLHRGADIQETLKGAAAVAAAAAESESTVGFEPARAKELENMAVVIKL